MVFSHDVFTLFVKCIRASDQLIYLTDSDLVYRVEIHPAEMIPNNHSAAD